MITFKKKEIIYRPYEPIMKLISDLIMIICAAYLLVTSFFSNTTIVGHSMNDTLQNGDTVLINSIAYKFNPPSRYDVIVFEPKIGNVSQYYVKRVIGLPGETIQIKDGRVYIDNNLLEDDVITTEIHNAGLAEDPIVLGYNEYFVLGDNRNNSDDSRFSNVGLVKGDTIIGKPWLTVYPFSSFGIINAKEPVSDDKEAE
ncbi:MAG: signal peptidase I [Butyrivibrio sp.]